MQISEHAHKMDILLFDAFHSLQTPCPSKKFIIKSHHIIIFIPPYFFSSKYKKKCLECFGNFYKGFR